MKLETIIEPNAHILEIQRRYIEIVKNTLPSRHIEAVGGMAVPMTGRPELDILVITDDVEGDTKKLETIGFGNRGVADDALYIKQLVEGVEVTVQIMSEDNKMVETHRRIIALLRENESLRQAYESFKRTLSGLTRDEYKKQKTKWLKENVLPKLN